MLVEGHGRELYHRQRQWDVVRRGFPAADEAPIIDLEGHLPRSERKLARSDEDLRHDADRLMGWLMGSDPQEWRTVGGAAAAPLAQGPFTNPFATVVLARQSEEAITPAIVEAVAKPAIGGPLYPPVHAFFYAPIALFRPLTAYHVFQVIALLMSFVAGLGVTVLTRGRIPWSIATLVLLLYSGNRGGLDLAQNPDADTGHRHLGLGAGFARLQHRRRCCLGALRVQAGLGAGIVHRAAVDAAVAVLRGDDRHGSRPLRRDAPVRWRADVARLAGGWEGSGQPVQREPELDHPEPRSAERPAPDLARFQSGRGGTRHATGE